jgi:uncharacterized protein YndB with AHSA1/START domain
METTPNEIRKVVIVQAPLEKVWEAISDSTQFGHWFGAQISGSFEPGKRLKLTIEPTRVDPQVAKSQEAYRGIEFDIWVEEVEPQRRFSFRWHPYEVDGEEPESAPTTLVEFTLQAREDSTEVVIVESGFDSIPLHKRAKAFENNTEGWEVQAGLLQTYVETAR